MRSEACASTMLRFSRAGESVAWFGFRPAGFLGLLHMEIIQERGTASSIWIDTDSPGLQFQITKTDGSSVESRQPARLPAHPLTEIEKIDEPVILATF